MKRTEQDLIGRAVVEPDFRKRLLADPDEVIASEGYEISDLTRARIREAAASTPEAINAAIAAAAREGGVGG